METNGPRLEVADLKVDVVELERLHVGRPGTALELMGHGMTEVGASWLWCWFPCECSCCTCTA